MKYASFRANYEAFTFSKSKQMCGPLKRQVVHYIMRLLICCTYLRDNTSLVSVNAPSCVGKQEEQDEPYLLCHTSSSSAELAADLGSALEIYCFLCICELLHQALLLGPHLCARLFVCVAQRFLPSRRVCV